jgi:hypothetical protein
MSLASVSNLSGRTSGLWTARCEAWDIHKAVVHNSNRAVSGKPDILDCASHFERMYDNSQLARVYLHAWQVTGDEFFRTITEEILDYVIREMTNPAGGFCST